MRWSFLLPLKMSAFFKETFSKAFLSRLLGLTTILFSVFSISGSGSPSAYEHQLKFQTEQPVALNGKNHRRVLGYFLFDDPGKKFVTWIDRVFENWQRISFSKSVSRKIKVSQFTRGYFIKRILIFIPRLTFPNEEGPISPLG